jgi:transposase-like protein
VTKRKRDYTPEFKFQLVLKLLTGERRAAQLCREHQISETSLSRWRQQLLDNGAKAFESDNDSSADRERIADLERMVGRLTMELTAAKKLSDWLDSQR